MNANCYRAAIHGRLLINYNSNVMAIVSQIHGNKHVDVGENNPTPFNIEKRLILPS